jgi:hypothetical protein
VIADVFLIGASIVGEIFFDEKSVDEIFFEGKLSIGFSKFCGAAEIKQNQGFQSNQTKLGFFQSNK